MRIAIAAALLVVGVALVGSGTVPLIERGAAQQPGDSSVLFLPLVFNRSTEGSPYISSISPLAGTWPGEVVTISGHGFGADQTAVSGDVYIGGSFTGPTLSWIDSSIAVTIPTSVGTGNQVVQVLANGQASNSVIYPVLSTPTPTVTPTPTDTPTPTATPTVTPIAGPAPYVSGVDRSSVPRGALLTITGGNFGATQGEVTGSVWVGYQRADILSWADDRISCVVATNATTGTVPGYVFARAQSSNPFTVTVTAP
ncbi:MAG: IPT/TIG domain-containing protein [Chloroflexi bacterium]|nr:IPT/TIG domain-containing protein [Chloroflexota bacterium]